MTLTSESNDKQKANLTPAKGCLATWNSQERSQSVGGLRPPGRQE